MQSVWDNSDISEKEMEEAAAQLGRPPVMIVLGVDPGSLRTGYGAIETDGRRHRLLEMGALAPAPAALARPRSSATSTPASRALIERLRPDALAVEDVFHAANTRTALVLGPRARRRAAGGRASAACPVHEYPPATVKQQVTGFGRAEKGQVAFMVTRLLELGAEAEPGDATDALAVALCFACLRTSAGASVTPALPAAVSRA